MPVSWSSSYHHRAIKQYTCTLQGALVDVLDGIFGGSDGLKAAVAWPLSLSLSLSLSLFLSLSRSLSSKNVVAGSNIMHDNVGLGWLQCDEPKSSFPRFHSEFPE